MRSKLLAVVSVAVLAAGVAAASGDIVFHLGNRVSRYLTSTLNGVQFSSSTGISEPFDLNRDFYVEFVMRLDKSHPSSALMIGSFGGMDVRYLRGPFQLLFTGSEGGTKYVFNGTVNARKLRWPLSDLHHVVLTSTGRSCKLYVDGEHLLTDNWSANYELFKSDGRKNANSRNLSFAPSHEICIFRVGYLACETNGVACAGEDPETLVATHYNNGNPFGYTASAPTRLVDMVRKNFKMNAAFNPIAKARLTPAKTLQGTLSWRTDDPYAETLRASHAPALAPRYEGQYYRDSSTGRMYVATGNKIPADWRGFVYDEDIEKVLLKTLGGVSLFGSGNIVLNSADPSREVVDVTTTGAVGDGLADDTAAIVEAVRQAKAGGKGVYFPVTAGGGTYRVTSPIGLDGEISVIGANGAVIESEGTAFAVTGAKVQISDLAFISSGASAIRLDGASLVHLNRITVESDASGVEIVNASDVWMENVLVSATLAGVRLTGSKRVSVAGGSFTDCAAGVLFDGDNAAALVTGSVFLKCQTGLAASAGDVDVLAAQNVFDACSAAGVAVTGSKRVNIRNNAFRSFSATARPIVLGATYSAVSGNVISRAELDATAADIVLAGSRAVTVSGNVMDGRIDTEGAADIAESGNLKAE